MVLPEDKFVILMRYLKIWADTAIPCLSLVATRTARGFLLSISEAFTIGKADIAHVTHMQTAGEALARRMPRVPCEAIMVPKSAEALGAFGFWAEALTSWDRRRLCVLEFGPCCTWQALGRLDASTDGMRRFPAHERDVEGLQA